MAKTNPGRFFEDYNVGDVIQHAVPRTVSGGERALYHALYPARHALYSSDEFARAVGLPKAPLDDLAAFHVVFGKTVPDVSLNAVANLGYAEGRWLRPVLPGETLTSTSEVIGVKQNSNGKTGVVWVRTTGRAADGAPVLEYVRWVMVRKRDVDAPAPDTVVPELARSVDAGALANVMQHFVAQRFGFTAWRQQRDKGGDLLVLVDIDLDHLHLAAGLGHRGLQRRAKRPAGATPRRPEIHDDGGLLAGLDHIGHECGFAHILDQITCGGRIAGSEFKHLASFLSLACIWRLSGGFPG